MCQELLWEYARDEEAKVRDIEAACGAPELSMTGDDITELLPEEE